MPAGKRPSQPRTFSAFTGAGRRLILFGCALALEAHHSNAPFDMSREVTVHGIVKQFRWANPHSYITLEVEGRDWLLEAEALNLLRRHGWTKDSLQPGDRISCTGAPAKDPALLAMKCFLVEFPDGRRLPATPTSAAPSPLKAGH